MKKAVKAKKVKKKKASKTTYSKPLALNMSFDDAMKRLIKVKPALKN